MCINLWKEDEILPSTFVPDFKSYNLQTDSAHTQCSSQHTGHTFDS